MTDAPVRVEVVCYDCEGSGQEVAVDSYGAPLAGVAPGVCIWCNGDGKYERALAPGSLTEAMMQLAEATVRFEEMLANDLFAETPEWHHVREAYDAALARVCKIKGGT